MATTRRLHGEILLERGAITPEKLDRALRDQLVRKLFHVFSFPSGTEFQFFEGIDALGSYGGTDGPLRDPLAVVWRACSCRPHGSLASNGAGRVGGGRMHAVAADEPGRSHCGPHPHAEHDAGAPALSLTLSPPPETQLHERLENHPFAFRDYRKVVGLNAKNTEAMRQVRTYEMRVRNDSGLFRRFFKE